MKKKNLSIIAIALLLAVFMTACGGKNTTTETESPQETIVTVNDLKPLADKGVIVGVKDMKVSEGTKMSLVDSVVVDKKIVTNITCEDHTDYGKAGTYKAVFTITFDSEALNKFVKDNSLKLNFKTDADSDSVRIKVEISVTILAKEDADKAIENGDKSVVTEETVADVQKENQETAQDHGNSNAVSGGSISHDEPAPAEKPAKPNKPAEKPTEPSKPDKPAEPTKPDEKPTEPSKPDKPTEPSEPVKPSKPDKPAHQHSYSSTVTKQPTCDSAGEKTFTCSCGKSYTESIPSTGHAWHHHDEVGHYEEITKDIIEWHAICNGCGKDFGPGEEGTSAAIDHIAAEFEDDCESYHSERRKVGTEVIDREWVVDTPAYDECTNCGKRR